ncbi:hypothetical protein, partial [Defluviitalea phaphyphila]|uniref:hypothetical protein n=1 Tax=Defluviitalea phaphyphila TaxID=1473580 RepID=UPI0013667BAF
MKYGENSLLVEEVIKEVGNIKLFKKSDKLLTDVIIINDFEKAQYLAFECDDYEMNNEKGYTWKDITELVMSKVYGIAYQNPDYKNFMKTLHSINGLIKKNLHILKEYEIVWEEVYCDLIDCARTRAIQGKTNKFFEKIFEVYKAGGWPCGWDGNY